MNRSVGICAAILVACTVMLAGCHGDPNVRKQKYLDSGKRYVAQGKYREAAIQFGNAVKIDKAYPEAHYELAKAYSHLGQMAASYAELRRTVELQPTNYRARIDLGNVLIAGGRTDDAQKQADVVNAALPNDPDVHALLAAIAIRRGQRDQAIAEMRRALELDPNRANFHDNMAFLLSSDSTKGPAVEEELKKSVALDPKSVHAKLLLASFYADKGNLQEAEKVSWAAVATDPKSLPARENVAQMILKEGDRPRAEQVLRQASQDLADDPQGVRILGDYYISSGQMDKAKAEFSSLAAKNPKDVALQKAYVRVLLQTKDFGAARGVAGELMKTNSKDPEVTALNGIVLLNDGKANDAVNALMDGAKNFPKDAFIQFWLGKAAQAKGDSELAEKSFRQAAELNPGEIAAEEALAQIAIQRNDLNLLSDVAGRTITSVPRFALGYVWRGMVEINRNMVDKGEADLKTATTVAPQSPEAFLELGRLRFSQKRFPDGVTYLEQALQNDPNSVPSMRLLIEYDINQKQPDKAMARLNAQIEKSPRNSYFYDMLAEMQQHDKKLDLAAASAQKAIELNSGDKAGVALFSQIQVQRGQVAAAITVWERWLYAHPNDAGVDTILGTLEESRGNMSKAEDYYRKALQIQPQEVAAANNLAYRMLENGENIDVALTLAQTARQGAPKSATTADTLAWAYYYKGTYSFARDLLEDAVRTDPNNATMQYHLGMVYSKLQDKSNATIHLKKAVSLGPNTPEAKQAQTALQRIG
jgi:Tfp pilus assembly protein PilF